MSKETRMNINLQEINVLNDWLTRISVDVDNVELRHGNEPGMGPAITAYVETNDDEGYFKLLTTVDGKYSTVRQTVQEAINTLTTKVRETND